MDIGSGKVDAETRRNIPHHCIDCADPDYDFSAGDFVREAEKACSMIQQRGRVPMFVGGTGLYIDSFFQGLSPIPQVSEETRRAVRNEMEETGPELLHHELQSMDPLFAERVHMNDRQRIARGIEVIRETGRSLTSYYDEKKGYGSSKTLYIGLTMEREALRSRISTRVDEMMAAGFLDEVARLREKGYGPELKSMRALGYRELHQYLDGKISLEVAVETVKMETARYAKRQMTWFRRNRDIRWFRPDEGEAIAALVHAWCDEE